MVNRTVLLLVLVLVLNLRKVYVSSRFVNYVLESNYALKQGIKLYFICVCVCERERERGGEGAREGGRERGREGEGEGEGGGGWYVLYIM